MNASTPGDIDGDGKLDRSDLDLLREVLEESGHGATLLEKLSPEERERLDVNQDGRIDRMDLVRLCEIMMADVSAVNQLTDRFAALREKHRR